MHDRQAIVPDGALCCFLGMPPPLRDWVMPQTQKFGQAPFAGLREAFARRREAFARLREAFAGLREAIAGLREAFAGLREAFAGLREAFATLRDALQVGVRMPASVGLSADAMAEGGGRGEVGGER
jgi:hypothetical protein